MKKNRKFVTFPIVNIKNIVIAVASIFIISISLFPLSTFILENLSNEFVELAVHIGTKSSYTPPHINIAKTVLSVSVPTIEFTATAKAMPQAHIPKAEIPTEEPTLPPPENTAESITIRSAEEKGYKSIDGIYINNQTSKTIDIKSLLNKELDLTLSNEPSVLIIHTHTTESYTPSELYNYTPTETDRTTDLNYNMASVGEVIYSELTQNGISTIHDSTINDYPSYSTSYSKSLKLVQSYTNKYPSIKIVIDVHRDAMVTKEGSKLRPLTSSDAPCAQVMTVVGTNDSGLEHANWQDNLSFAIKLQHKMNEMYPSLARPINLRRERFNQHTAPYAFILEVGTNGNTLEEAKEGARLFSHALISILKD